MSTDADTAASAAAAHTATAAAASANAATATGTATATATGSTNSPPIAASSQQADPLSLLTEISKINSTFRDKVKLFKCGIDELLEDEDDDDDSDTDDGDVEEYDMKTYLTFNKDMISIKSIADMLIYATHKLKKYPKYEDNAEWILSETKNSMKLMSQLYYVKLLGIDVNEYDEFQMGDIGDMIAGIRECFESAKKVVDELIGHVDGTSESEGKDELGDYLQVTTLKEEFLPKMAAADKSIGRLILLVDNSLPKCLPQEILDGEGYMALSEHVGNLLSMRDMLQEQLETAGLVLDEHIYDMSVDGFRVMLAEHEDPVFAFFKMLQELLESNLCKNIIEWDETGTNIIFPELTRVYNESVVPPGKMYFNSDAAKYVKGEAKKIMDLLRTLGLTVNKLNAPSAIKKVLHNKFGFVMDCQDNYPDQNYSEVVTGCHHPMFTRHTSPKDLLLLRKPHVLEPSCRRLQLSNYPECEVGGCNFICCAKQHNVVAPSESNMNALFYRTCHLHTNQDQELLEDLKWRNDDASIKAEIDKVERNAQEGQVYKEKYQKLQKEKKDLNLYKSAEQVFANPAFASVWEKLDEAKSTRMTLDEMSTLIHPASCGLRMEQFYDGSDLKNNPARANGTAFYRLYKFQQVCCKDCGRLVPGWKWDTDEEGKLTGASVDINFKDPGRFYGTELDHTSLPDGEEYILPSRLCAYHDQDTAKRHLLCTEGLCTGCHDSDSPLEGRQSSNRKHITLDPNYETKIWREEVKEPVHHSVVMNSDEFKRIQNMIRDYRLEYGGLKPLYSFKEVQYLFSKATNGKALRDYICFTANDWENRTDHYGYGTYFMNDLRINYIKKEARCCAGNENHATKCRIDIGNVVPRKLQGFHHNHGKYKAKKRGTMGKMKAWKHLEKEYNIIEEIVCSQCHAGE